MHGATNVFAKKYYAWQRVNKFAIINDRLQNSMIQNNETLIKSRFYVNSFTHNIHVNQNENKLRFQIYA